MESETITRSRRAEFRDIYVATVTANNEGNYTADTPVKLARAISGTITDRFTTEKQYSDDSVEDSATTYQGTDIELEVNNLAPQDQAVVYGHLYKNGYLVKNKDDKPPEVALGFRARKLNGKFEFSWYYCGVFGAEREKAFQTKGETKTPQTDTLNGTFYERQKDGHYSVEVDEGNLLEANKSAAAAIKAWFEKVQEPVDQEPGAG